MEFAIQDGDVQCAESSGFRQSKHRVRECKFRQDHLNGGRVYTSPDSVRTEAVVLGSVGVPPAPRASAALLAIVAAGRFIFSESTTLISVAGNLLFLKANPSPHFASIAALARGAGETPTLPLRV